MYVVDITRDNMDTDILCGNDSMDAKMKIINYISDYLFANYNFSIDKNILDRDLTMSQFSLNEFLSKNYSKLIDNDMYIQFFFTDKDNCIMVKHIDEDKTYPLVYFFNKNNKRDAESIAKFLINESLISKFKDRLKEYDRFRVEDRSDIYNPIYQKMGIYSKVISLYSGGLFMEELLTNSLSLNQLKKNNFRGLDL